MRRRPASMAVMVPSALLASVRDDWRTCGLVVLLTAAIALTIQLPAYLQEDVAYLAWTADQVLRGAVFGRDIYDVNPPLNFMIYVPAAVLGRLVGLDLAVKLWTVLVACVSIVSVWQVADRTIRLPVIAALGLFFALAFPGNFGQREQFALLLCAPYVAGNSERRGLALLNGVMAGIGFALKPYFLVPLLLVFATRRKIRTEEWTIAATGLGYAASLALFFQPYFTEMLPRALPYYWLYNNPMISIVLQVIMVPVMVAAMFLIKAPQKATAGYAMAAIGFTLAVILHRKGFAYHVIPCFGFLALYLAAMLENDRRMARLAAVFFLVVEIWWLSLFASASLYFMEKRKEVVPVLLAEIEKSRSFTILTNDNSGAFPAAILTGKPFLGISAVNNFISAVADFETGLVPGDARAAGRLALDQAIRELERQPDLVIVVTEWSMPAYLKVPFDGLAWFNRDPAFHALWQDYALTGQFEEFQFYRRK